MKIDLAIILNVSEAIVELLVNRYPELLIYGSGFILVWYLTSRWERLYGRFKFTESESKTIRNSHLPDLHNKYRAMDNKLNSIDTTLQKIELFLVTKFGMDSTTFRVKSPLGLTEASHEVLILSGGKEYVDKSMSELLKLVENQNPKSGIDIEDTCHMILLERSREDDEFITIKNYVFNNPVYVKDESKIWITLTVMIRIMAIYLRDRYVEDHKLT